MKWSNITKKVVISLFFNIGMTGMLLASVEHLDLMIKGNDTLYINQYPLNFELGRKVFERMEKDEKDCLLGSRWYQALWRLDQGELSLEAIRSDSSDPWGMFDLSGIFDAYVKRGRIVASWFSGEITLGRWEASGTLARQQRETVYTFDKGKMIAQKEYHNTMKIETIPFEQILRHVFDSESLPWEKDETLHVMIWPDKDGNLDSLEIFKNDVTGKVILTDDHDPFVREVKRCLAFIPEWSVRIVRNQIQPIWLPKCGELEKRERLFLLDELEASHLSCFDILVYNGKEYAVLAFPLQFDQRFFSSFRERLKGAFTRENPRGYTARWEINDNQLFLTGIRDGRTGEIIPLSEWDSENQGKILASWFTGDLRVRAGKPVFNPYGLKTVFEEEVEFQLLNGELLGQAEYHNYVHPADTAAYNLCDREIENADWGQFPELEGCSLEGVFKIMPRLDGKLQKIKLEELRVFKMDDPGREDRVIEDENHPYVKIFREALERIPGWDVRFIRGKLEPVSWRTGVNL